MVLSPRRCGMWKFPYRDFDTIGFHTIAGRQAAENGRAEIHWKWLSYSHILFGSLCRDSSAPGRSCSRSRLPLVISFFQFFQYHLFAEKIFLHKTADAFRMLATGGLWNLGLAFSSLVRRSFLCAFFRSLSIASEVKRQLSSFFSNVWGTRLGPNSASLHFGALPVQLTELLFSLVVTHDHFRQSYPATPDLKKTAKSLIYFALLPTPESLRTCQYFGSSLDKAAFSCDFATS